jgi:Flp pilus assembly protein TadG
MSDVRPQRRASLARAGQRPRRRFASSHASRVSRGQALVEFALIIFPLMLFMVVGATDISTLLDDHLDVVYAARAGARVGSVIGNLSPAGAPYTADCAVIGAVQSALSSARNVTVSQIAIYDATSVSDGEYSAGLPQDDYPGNTICNANGTTTPGPTSATWVPNGSNGPNPPPTRNNTPFSEDSLGVAITYSYTYDFNLVNLPTFSVTDWAVMPIEIVVNPTLPTPTPTPQP